MAENVRVVVRCRPMNRREHEMQSKNIVEIDNCAVNLNNPNDPTTPSKMFTFDNAYDERAPTEVLYNDICYNLVESVLEGYNGTIFAYGQTGCGKSHTMQGPADIFDKNFNANEKILSQRGIISRSFEHIFEAISVASGVRYLALVSFLEIYNENIRDLLNPCAASNNLQLKEIPGEGIIVQNLSTHTVHNSQECEELLSIGAKNRIVGSTLMNAGSSRSHSIFTINLEQISTSSKLEPGEAPSIKKGKLNLVDLAGSERQNKTGATGDRLKEATKINLSLSALGNVISALVDGKTKHIPYRDAKLTRLLQDSLGGNTKTLMIACIAPSEYNYDETLSTLRYASRAKNIHNKPKINEDPKDTMLREYQEEIIKLKNLLNSTTVNNNNNNSSSIENLNLANEKEKLRLQYEDQVRHLKTEYEIEKREKEDLYQNIEVIKQEYENKLKHLGTTIASTTTEETQPVTKSDFDFDDLNEAVRSNATKTTSSVNLLNSDDVIERLQVIKNALIGGEKSNDIQLKEKRNKKKVESEKRLSALAHAINRIEQSEDRDLLQGHYTSIQQELQIKTDSLKKQRQKIRALEREVTDIQAEFQLDRADYLETIRRLEKNLKFYQQMVEIAVPLLRKDGRFWDIDTIRSESVWNDDLKKWKLCEQTLGRRKLPPAVDSKQRSGRESTSLTAPGRLESSSSSRNSSIEHLNNCSDYETGSPDSSNSPDDENDFLMRKLQNSDGNSIVDSYFRPKRANELIHQSRAFNTWKFIPDYASNSHHKKNNLNASWATLHQVSNPNNNSSGFGGGSSINRFQNSGSTITNKLNNFLVPGGGGGVFGTGGGLGGSGGLNMNLNKTWNGITSSSLNTPTTQITRDV